MIGVKLVDFRGLTEIRRWAPAEFALAVLTALTVVVFGVEQGILLAAALSLLEHVRHSYRPHIGVMVRDAGGTWRLEEPVPGRMAEPGLVMFWFGRDLFYANGAFFAEQARRLVNESPSPVRWLVIEPPRLAAWIFPVAVLSPSYTKTSRKRASFLPWFRSPHNIT